MLDLGLPLLKPARPEDDLVGNADEIGDRELGTGGLVTIGL